MCLEFGCFGSERERSVCKSISDEELAKGRCFRLQGGLNRWGSTCNASQTISILEAPMPSPNTLGLLNASFSPHVTLGEGALAIETGRHLRSSVRRL